MAKAPTKTAPAKAKSAPGRKPQAGAAKKTASGPVGKAEIKQRIMMAVKKAAGDAAVKKAPVKKAAPAAKPTTAKKPASKPAATKKTAKSETRAKAPVEVVIESEFKVGNKVKHATFGAGTVREVKGDILTIEFKSGDLRNIREDFVELS